jgi:hypothetical protein
MSMPSYNLICNKCKYSVSNMIFWHKSSYVDGKTEFFCNKSMGWCDDCSEITPVEDFENTDYELEEINKRTQWLRDEQGTFWQALCNLIFPSRRRLQHSYLNDIYSAYRAISLASKRIGTECCLNCGSRKIEHVNSKAKLNLSNNMTYTGSSGTGFIHPRCGGELISNGSNMRYSVKTRTKLYSTEGKFIREYFD